MLGAGELRIDRTRRRLGAQLGGEFAGVLDRCVVVHRAMGEEERRGRRGVHHQRRGRQRSVPVVAVVRPVVAVESDDC
ncbi:hypothetical protein SDC9_145156 [bioreactor metagenome]|uniref:Uncharacterized protein n=1 Tax=bioreactor metagenome TaxID=1076179 RepID=A0A645E924_9ZZZZ